jgi:hypothetical protein
MLYKRVTSTTRIILLLAIAAIILFSGSALISITIHQQQQAKGFTSVVKGFGPAIHQQVTGTGLDFLKPSIISVLEDDKPR